MNTKRNVKILNWFNFLILFVPYAPVAIIYFARVSGSYSLAASVFTIGMIAQSLLEIPTGILSDKIGKKNTLILGTGAALLNIILYALGTGYWFLFAGAFFGGLSRALWSGNNDALLYESVRAGRGEEHYPKVSGRMNALIQIALGSSAVLGGFLANQSYSLLMWISVIPIALALGLSFFLVEVHAPLAKTTRAHIHFKEAIRLFMNNEKLRLVSLYTVLTDGVGGAAYEILPAFYATIVPTWVLGIVNFVNKASVYFSFHFSHFFIKKLGEKVLLIANDISVRVLPLLGLTFISSASPFIMSVDGVLWGAAAVARGHLFQKGFSDTHRSTMGSFNSLGISIIFGISAWSLGSLADTASPRIALIAAQLILIPTFFLLLKGLKSVPNSQPLDNKTEEFAAKGKIR